MKTRLAFLSVAVAALFLILLPTAAASTTWYVDGINGNDGNDCKSPTTACKTIGHAISLAVSHDSVSVAAATYKENLTIAINLRIVGASTATTVVDGGSVGTTITISGVASVELSQLTITHGVAINNGGGIFNPGTLTISRSTISGNTAGSIFKNCPGNGGGVYNSGTLTVNSSTISGNLARVSNCLSPSSAYGGGLYNSGTLIINNSTVSGNSVTANCSLAECQGSGGGIANFGQTIKISNSTISGNSAKTDAGGIYNGATLQNTIVANATSGGNCSGVMTSLGYNLSSDNTCNLTGPGDLNNTDPMLGPLQNNGGPTQTQALLSGSAATDAGNPSGCTDGSGNLLKTDQRRGAAS